MDLINHRKRICSLNTGLSLRGILLVFFWVSCNDIFSQNVSYEKEVLPILEEHCFDCHGDGTTKGDISLDSWDSPQSRISDIEIWKDVLKNVSLKLMPPAKRKSQPSDQERKKIIDWIENEVFRLDSDNPDPGRVTIRRLNKQEYNNTIRDLMMIDFEPAKDFPPDDSGYGFDNIGDVLSISPVLLEKYLKAANQVTSAAIRTSDPPEKIKKYGTSKLKGGEPRGGARILPTNGSVTVRHKFSQGGEYIVKIRAGAEQAGNEPAKMPLYVGGKKRRTFEVKNRPEKMQVYEYRLRIDDEEFARKYELDNGIQLIETKFINDFYDPKNKDPRRRDRNLYVSSIEVEGPLGESNDKLPDFHQKIFSGLQISPENRLKEAKKILWQFTNRAYRRKVPEAEIERLMRFVKIGIEAGGDYAFENGIKLACQAVLTSPFFLFRGEIQPDPNDPDATYRIDEYSLASRLSYFIWSSMPDDELFLHATQSTLRKNLKSQVNRMLKDPKAKSLTSNFAGQWLQLRDVSIVDPDPKTYKEFDDELKISMKRETEMLFEHILKEDLPVTDLLSAPYSFINKRLSMHYEIKGFEGDGFRKTSLEGTRRKGILTHGSILTITSNATRTSPVKRGKWILENILGTLPPEPPPGVDELDGNKKLKGNLRQRLEQHREDPNCSSCHALMDPLGLVYENFNGIGKWRENDEGAPIDASGKLVSGESFKTHEEFQKILLTAKREDFLRCASEMILTYALGRGIEFYDKLAIKAIVKSLKSSNLKFSSLVFGVVNSVPFQYRRGDGRRIYD
tara:strand:- start:1689 stop:4064 length:2376 start_codon:yes stop_codon:yes gene_type:complete